MQKGGFVYMMTNGHKRVLYIGVTSDLKKRVWEHRNKVYPKSFTAKYNCVLLVYYCYYDSIEVAIEQEKKLKDRSRQNKETLILEINANWNDLWSDVENW